MAQPALRETPDLQALQVFELVYLASPCFFASQSQVLQWTKTLQPVNNQQQISRSDIVWTGTCLLKPMTINTYRVLKLADDMAKSSDAAMQSSNLHVASVIL